MSAPQLTVSIDGTGAINGDLLNTFAQTCDTAAELRSFVGIQGVQVYIRGTASAGDGGQGFFYWNTTGTAPDDNGVTTIVPYGSGSGEWTRLVTASGGLINIRSISSTAIYTPTAGTNAVLVEAVAGGGAGGGSQGTTSGQSSAGSGGGSGSSAKGYYTSGFSGVLVTVGDGGVGVTGANGTGGGTTSFGSLISCPGGGYGLLGAAESGPMITGVGTGGAAPVGSLLLNSSSGQPGTNGVILAAGAQMSGQGGGGVTGGGGGNTANGNGNPGSSPGAGGGGGASGESGSASAGGNGASGQVTIYEFS